MNLRCCVRAVSEDRNLFVSSRFLTDVSDDAINLEKVFMTSTKAKRWHMFRSGISDGEWTGKGKKQGKREFGSADGKWDGKRDENQAVFPFSSQHPVFAQTSVCLPSRSSSFRRTSSRDEIPTAWTCCLGLSRRSNQWIIDSDWSSNAKKSLLSSKMAHTKLVWARRRRRN